MPSMFKIPSHSDLTKDRGYTENMRLDLLTRNTTGQSVVKSRFARVRINNIIQAEKHNQDLWRIDMGIWCEMEKGYDRLRQLLIETDISANFFRSKAIHMATKDSFLHPSSITHRATGIRTSKLFRMPSRS